MRSSISLRECLEVAETDRNTVNYLRRTERLRSEIPETSSGVPTALPRQAVLEIAFISALADAGMKLVDAAERVDSEFMHRTKKVKGELLYGVNARTGNGFWFSNPKMPLAQLQHQLGNKHRVGSPVLVSVIDVAELVRRIDALFESQD